MISACFFNKLIKMHKRICKIQQQILLNQFNQGTLSFSLVHLSIHNVKNTIMKKDDNCKAVDKFESRK